MKKLLLEHIVFILFVFLAAWALFGLEVLPKTHWTWVIGDPIEMQGTIIPTTSIPDEK